MTTLDNTPVDPSPPHPADPAEIHADGLYGVYKCDRCNRSWHTTVFACDDTQCPGNPMNPDPPLDMTARREPMDEDRIKEMYELEAKPPQPDYEKGKKPKVGLTYEDADKEVKVLKPEDAYAGNYFEANEAYPEGDDKRSKLPTPPKDGSFPSNPKKQAAAGKPEAKHDEPKHEPKAEDTKRKK